MSWGMIIASVIIATATGITSAQQTKATKSSSRMAQQRNDQALARAKAEKDNADEQARSSAKRRKIGMARSKTTQTSPLGIAGQAETVQNTLLGQ